MRRALVCLTALLVSAASLATPAAAGDRVTLGWGRLFNNDALGDMKDRWRTGGYVVSLVRGRDWSGVYPDRPGEMIEFRIRSEVIAPANLVNPVAGDRRYAGVLSLGMHTHFSYGALENSVGVDLVAIGPMTGIGSFQKTMHNVFGLDEPTVLDDQLGNQVHPTLTAETGRTFHISDRLSVRPFAEMTAGVETMARIGGDVLIGGVGQGDILLRDVVTGQRYRASNDGVSGLSFALGGDIAKVYDSAYLPEDQGYTLSDSRVRLRAGVNWQGERAAVFYGVTWLGEEFEGQPEGQMVGSLRLHLRF
ncbi:lipid A deacylase LpxR family protein [Frigidibacter sp. ROC022]|uniref:lipid A deacylase LpxR family protein n=1 Tax=Frigidibacter sp. ROC022 TaxID=2971796 RepID=UPI00215A9481|nr:lipid A deacylase LpxR family protein [Frigidibacter sp. ROC022]MCR8722911.1 lipid A deacylase LpxR family protein [Frigidibacter sp. ROC022]